MVKYLSAWHYVVRSFVMDIVEQFFQPISCPNGLNAPHPDCFRMSAYSRH